MSLKICGIYQITNKTNKKKYIGQSQDIHQRWYHHRYDLNNNNHENPYLQQSWNKHGEDNFTFEIITECKPNELNDLEEYYINKYNTFTNRDNGYNLQSGGGYRQLSDEVCQKISEKNSGEGHWNYGQNLTLNHQIKMSKTTTSTGFLRVTKHKDKKCIRGFRYVYRYYQNNKRREISNVDVLKLKEAVIKKGLEWVVTDEVKAELTLKESNTPYGKQFEHHTLESKTQISKSMNTTGYYGVHKKKSKTAKQGFLWVYAYYDENHKRRTISRVDLKKLEEEVKKQNLTWIKY